MNKGEAYSYEPEYDDDTNMIVNMTAFVSFTSLQLS